MVCTETVTNSSFVTFVRDVMHQKVEFYFATLEELVGIFIRVFFIILV